MIVLRHYLALSFLLFFVNQTFALGTEVKSDSMMLQESVVVTIEEHFGPGVLTVADALGKIERRSQPFDNQGRTFAILDAYGNMLPDGRMHISMHISSEKAGGAMMVMSGSGKVLWNCRIYPKADGSKVAANKQLNIYIEREGETDKYYTVDGSKNPASIFECRLDETKELLGDYWKENTVKKFIFIYSACGCPVHVRFLRKGNKSVFQDGEKVIFPDDPAVFSMLKRLMAW